MVTRPLRQVLEIRDAGIHGTGKGAEIDFVIVARVDDDDVAAGNEGIPVRRLDIGAEALHRHGFAQADGFLLQAHAGLAEGLELGQGFLPADRALDDIGLKMIEKVVDGLARAGDRRIDAFARDQQRALDAGRLQAFQQERLVRLEIGEIEEMVEGGNNELRLGGGLEHGADLAQKPCASKTNAFCKKQVARTNRLR